MTVEKKYRSRCFFDVEVGGQNIGRVVFELYSDVCPITCENFRALCTGEKGVGKTTGKPLHYKSTVFHRVVKGFMIQGGDFSAGNGSGGESIYGGTFPDENFDLNHDSSFCLSMANRGKDTNGSQFFITTLPAPHLDGVHVVFGHVISGQEIVTEIENQLTDQSSRPFTDVKILNCGELVLKSKSKGKHRKSDKDGSPLEEGEMSDDKSKHKKKHKKHSKRNKKEKHQRKEDTENIQNENSRTRKDSDFDCSVRADEIPDIPTNNFLMRRGPLESDEPRRAPYRPEGYMRRTKISKSGRKIKGRGHMRYRTPSPEGSRSGSETPPHWRQAQSRVRSLKEVLEEKKKLLEELEAQESNEDEEQEADVHYLPAEEYSERLPRANREMTKEQHNFPRKENLEAMHEHKGHEGRGGSNRHHSEHITRSQLRERPSGRRDEMAESRVSTRGGGRSRDHRSRRRRDDSEEEYDSSTSPVRKGMQSTVISKVVYQNKPSEIVTASAQRPVRRVLEEKSSKPKRGDREKTNHNSSMNNSSKSLPSIHSKRNVEEREHNGVSGHRHHHHRHHHKHKSEKRKDSTEAVVEDMHAELGQSPMASLEVDKDTSIVDMDCTPIIHPSNEEESSVVISEKPVVEEERRPDPIVPVPEKQELYREPEPKLNESPRIRIPGLGSDDDSDGSVEEEPPPPPGTEDIVLFKNYPPAMPPGGIPFISDSTDNLQDADHLKTDPSKTTQEELIPLPPQSEKEAIPTVTEEFPRPPVQKLPFLDDTDDECVPPPAVTSPVPVKKTPSPVRDSALPPPPSKEIDTPAIGEKPSNKERRSPSPKKEKDEVKESGKSHVSSKTTEASRNSRADRSSSRSRTTRRRSRSRGSRSPRRGSSTNRRRSLSRGRRRISPPYRNRSPFWRRSADYRRPIEAGRRRRTPSPDRRRSRSRSKNRSRRTPPRYNRRLSRSPSRGRRGKRSRSSSSSSSTSSNDSRRRSKRGRKSSRSRSSSSSSSTRSSSSSSSSSSS